MLTGKIEYDYNDQPIEEFSGFLKLSNDPKIA